MKKKFSSRWLIFFSIVRSTRPALQMPFELCDQRLPTLCEGAKRKDEAGKDPSLIGEKKAAVVAEKKGADKNKSSISEENWQIQKRRR